MNRNEMLIAQRQALKPPPLYGVCGLCIEVPADNSAEEVIATFATRLRARFVAQGVDPDDPNVGLVCISLPCGCSVVYRQEASIPRYDQRCYCGVNWFVRYQQVAAGGEITEEEGGD